MSVTARGSTSIRKADILQQRNTPTTYRRVVFAHKATAGETGINLLNLTTPTEMTSVGFSQPSFSELQAIHLKFNRKNLEIVSSSRGQLQDYVSYNVNTSNQIEFNGFTADADEIFVCTVTHQPATGVNVVDAAPLVSTGTLPATEDEYYVGQSFEVNKYSTSQIGAVLVYVEGALQLRNSGNATASPSADGNYQEIDSGDGSGSIIKFNTTVAADQTVMVVSNGLLVNNPDDSRDQTIESLAGQVDAMIPTLASVAGVPESDFQAAPNQVDLKAFSSKVNSMQRYHVIDNGDSPYDVVSPVDLLLVDTTSGAVTVTLSSSPSIGDRVMVMDSESNFGTTTLTIDGNGNDIDGSASNFTISTDDAWAELIFVDSTRGWVVRV